MPVQRHDKLPRIGAEILKRKAIASMTELVIDGGQDGSI
jgi:hypothetical protein